MPGFIACGSDDPISFLYSKTVRSLCIQGEPWCVASIHIDSLQGTLSHAQVESLQVWNTLVGSNTCAYAQDIPSLCIQGTTWCVSSSHLVSSLQHHLGSITRPLSYPIRYVLVCIHCQGLSLCQESVSFSLSFHTFQVSFLSHLPPSHDLIQHTKTRPRPLEVCKYKWVLVQNKETALVFASVDGFGGP